MTMLFILICLITYVVAEYPYDPPFANYIDVVPRCYDMGLCIEYGEPGNDVLSIHPSSEERTLQILRNMPRLYADTWKDSKYGERLWGYTGSETWQLDTNGQCGIEADYPAYWYSMGNQASRFHAWDINTCDTSPGHTTCPSPDRCSRMLDGSCGFSARSKAFIPLGGIWGKAEGIFGHNNGLADGHCNAVFEEDYKYFGIGYYPGMASVTMLYIKNGPPRDYPIYMGSHLDERTRMDSGNYNSDGKHLTFLLGWFGLAEDKDGNVLNEQADTVYVAYKDDMHVMDKIFSKDNSGDDGIYEAHMNLPSNQECEPYAFYVFTKSGAIYRLPESEDYFYGTAWVELEPNMPYGPGNGYPECIENHYYKDSRYPGTNNGWIVNGGPNITKNAITYISQNSCQGCDKVPDLIAGIESFMAGDTDDDETTSTTTTTTTTTTTQPPNNNGGGGCPFWNGADGFQRSLNRTRYYRKVNPSRNTRWGGLLVEELTAEYPGCTDYTSDVQEENSYRDDLEKYQVDFQVKVCFHCDESDAQNANGNNNNNNNNDDSYSGTHYAVFGIVLFVIIAVICVAAFFAFRFYKKRNGKKYDYAASPTNGNHNGDNKVNDDRENLEITIEHAIVAEESDGDGADAGDGNTARSVNVR